MASVILICTVCGQQNTFPRIHASTLGKEGMTTFCNNCSNVTQQRISGGALIQQGAPAAAAAASAAPKLSAPMASAQLPETMGIGTPAGDDALWKRLQDAAANNGLTMGDIYRIEEDPKLMKLLQTIGFNSYEGQTLCRVVRDRDPRRLLAPPAPSVADAVQSPTGGRGGSSSIQSRPTPGRPIPMLPDTYMPSSQPYSIPEQSPIRGLTFTDGQMIARCSVYPDLPAEFWCCTCNVLVSSRCHVVGVHKDHPFITMRLAAEAHVRDLATWNERCRAQLGVTESVVSNLQSARSIVEDNMQRQFESLDSYVEQIYSDLLKWRDQLKSDIHVQTEAQCKSIDHSALLSSEMTQTYSNALRLADPLISTIPPVDQQGRAAEEWALRVLDLVSKLKLMNMEPVPLPKVYAAEVRCIATPSTHMELLKAVSAPIGVRLPDLLDPGYFNYPHPTSSARVPFTITAPQDAKQKGLLIYSGRTLTRAQDHIPSHCLVTGSQVFYNGMTSWEVHVDRLGAGPGRVLAGIVIHGTDGEGIVWDGHRIVGPNDGECRTIDEKYIMRPGTVLRFVLELDPPNHFLNCFFDRDGIARIPLPPVGSGWMPAFSVFGPQDQVTVVPTSTTTKLTQMSEKPKALVTDDAVAARLAQQEHLISSLQQQLQAVHSRIDVDQYRATVVDATSRGSSSRPQQQQQQQQQAFASPMQRTPSAVTPPARTASTDLRTLLQGEASATAPAAATAVAGGDPSQAGNRRTPLQSAYSPELKQLLRFVEDMK